MFVCVRNVVLLVDRFVSNSLMSWLCVLFICWVSVLIVWCGLVECVIVVIVSCSLSG